MFYNDGRNCLLFKLRKLLLTIETFAYKPGNNTVVHCPYVTSGMVQE